jgi:hypothetical protein
MQRYSYLKHESHSLIDEPSIPVGRDALPHDYLWIIFNTRGTTWDRRLSVPAAWSIDNNRLYLGDY